MGSPVSVVVANLVMGDLEMKALNTYANRPRMYYRYVDDTIAAVKKTNIDDFHQHLNPLIHIYSSPLNDIKIQEYHFWIRTLNFVEPDGSISTSVYRKETHSDRYLHFTSHHSVQHKKSVVETLYNRAACISPSKRVRNSLLLLRHL